jgi:hypothetical protein
MTISGLYRTHWARFVLQHSALTVLDLHFIMKLSVQSVGMDPRKRSIFGIEKDRRRGRGRQDKIKTLSGKSQWSQPYCPLTASSFGETSRSHDYRICLCFSKSPITSTFSLKVPLRSSFRGSLCKSGWPGLGESADPLKRRNMYVFNW